MDPKVEEALQFINQYAPQINEWKILKRELMKCLDSTTRKLFSTRNPVTKKQNFNQFERIVADRWQVISNTTLIIT